MASASSLAKIVRRPPSPQGAGEDPVGQVQHPDLVRGVLQDPEPRPVLLRHPHLGPNGELARQL